MKILFTGGGTGGHFYPIIAVAEAIHEVAREKKLIEPQLYYAAPHSYSLDTLVAHNIIFVPTAAGKIRNYFSLRNIVDYFKTGWGVLVSILRIFFLYPDVVFGKGGYASFPTLLAARLFGIPVIIHESDAAPGRVNTWAGKFATKIAVSFDDAAKFFPPEKVAYTGNPLRSSILRLESEGGYDFLKLDRSVPVLLVLGGSQGAVAINEGVLMALPQLIDKYQIIHQTGEANIADVEGRAKVIASNHPHFARYKPFGYLNDLAMRMSAGVAEIVISRAGSTIFEIAIWGKPSILIPIPEPISHDQTKNAYAYARTGAAVVIEQNNLKAGVLVAEINRIAENEGIRESMIEAAKKFARTDAAHTIAESLIDIALSHES